MKSMVCNCNSFGNVDYGIPLLLHIPDYRTSAEVGLKYMPPIHQEFYSLYPTISPSSADLLTPIQESYKTVTHRDFHDKRRKWNENGVANKSNSFAKTHYMITLKEKMFQNPPAPKKFELEEYKSQYRFKQVEPFVAKTQSPAEAICPVSSIGKGEQPRIKTEDKGVMKHLDPYVTTSGLSYIPFTKDQINGAKKHIITYYESKNSPEIKISNLKKPINDEVKFKKVIKNRIVPKLIYRVPFTGKISEYKDSFVPPTKGCFASHTFDAGVEYEESLSNASMWQTLAPPNMYCRESCHIGTGWPVRAAVSTSADDKTRVYKHKLCSSFYM